MLEILLISDDAAKPQMLADVFRRSARNIETHVNTICEFDEALEALRDWTSYSGACYPHLILLDLGLPSMGGFAVLEKLKTDIRLREIPVIVTSQLDEESTLSLAMELSTHQFIVISDTTRSYENVAESIREIIAQTRAMVD